MWLQGSGEKGRYQVRGMALRILGEGKWNWEEGMQDGNPVQLPYHKRGSINQSLRRDYYRKRTFDVQMISKFLSLSPDEEMTITGK